MKSIQSRARGKQWNAASYKVVLAAWRAGSSTNEIAERFSLGKRKVKEVVAELNRMHGTTRCSGTACARRRLTHATWMLESVRTKGARARKVPPNATPRGARARPMNMRELNAAVRRAEHRWQRTSYWTTVRDVRHLNAGGRGVVRATRNRLLREVKLGRGWNEMVECLLSV